MKLPITATPSRLKQAHYEHLLRLQDIWHRLVYSLLKERETLLACLAQLAPHDPLMALHWEVGKLPPLAAPAQAMFMRMDYMLEGDRMALVEMNSLSVGQIATAGCVADCHRRHDPSVVENNPLAGQVSLLRKAVNLYEKAFGVKDPGVLLLVDDTLSLNPDQIQVIEGMRAAGLALSVATLANVDLALSENKALFCSGHEIAVVLMRVGYQWDHFATQTAVDHFKAIYQSRAVQVGPPLAWALNMKRLQQLLYSDRSILEAHLPPDEASLLWNCFQEQHPVNAETLALVARNPAEWVLKPNRGGGGNNYFGPEIHLPAEPEAWILQRMIQSNTHRTQINSRDCEVIPEFGIFGAMLWTDTDIIISKPEGYLVRTKPMGVLEGGVAAGNAYLDSISLLPN